MKIINIGGDVVGVCALKESSVNADFCDLTVSALENNIPCCYVDDINSEQSIEWISKISPDIIFCFGWSRLLTAKILSIAPMGIVGFHPAALPANRGRHPIIWALALGLKETAATFFFMDDGVDSGDILSQARILISDYDDAKSLYEKVVLTASSQIEEFLPQLLCGTHSRIKQDSSETNTWRKRGRKDGLIDWRMDAKSIHNLVRALTKPYAGAEFNYNGMAIKVWRTEIIFCDQDNIEPGKVIDVLKLGFPVVKCGKDAIALIEAESVLVITKGAYL